MPNVYVTFSPPEDKCLSFEEAFGMSYEEFLKLDEDEQEEARLGAYESITENEILECSLHVEGIDDKK